MLQAGRAYQQALLLYSQDQFEPAADLLRQVVRKQPRSVTARFLFGATLLRLHRNAEAIRELETANRLNPRHGEAAKLLAAEYLAAKRSAEAIRVLRPLVTVAGADQETFLLLIQAHQNRGEADDLEAALHLADQALARFPHSAPVLASKASVARHNGRVEEARQLLEQSLGLDSSYLPARALLAEVLELEGKPDQAVTLFRAVLEQDPDDVESRLGLSRALASGGQLEAALGELNHARDLAPDNPRIRFRLAQLYWRLGNPQKARQEEEAFRRLKRTP